MPTSKNIIVGAASVFLGPGLDTNTATPINTRIAASRPAFVANTSYRTNAAALGGATGTTSTGVGSLVTNWRDVGYTQDGVEVSTDPSWGEVEVDQLLDSAKIFKDGMSLSISTTFAESTLENLVIAWGQSSATSLSSVAPYENELAIEGGALGEAPTERGLIFVGNAVERATSNAYGERVYQAYRVLSVESSAHSLARADATVIPVTFRALPADNGRYGSVRDRLNITIA